MKKLLLLLTLLFITIGCKESPKPVKVDQVSKLPQITIEKTQKYQKGDVIFLKPDSIPMLVVYKYSDSSFYDVEIISHHQDRFEYISHKAFY